LQQKNGYQSRDNKLKQYFIMINYTATYTDKYQLTMSQVYFLKGQKNTRSIFDYFFRKLPFNGGYAIFAGLDDLLKALEVLHFDKDDLEFLAELGYHPDFIKYLKEFRFTGSIYSSLEGDLVFPFRPVLQVEANIIEAQIIETLLLNILNYQTLVATKASRMRQASEGRSLIDFGLRRAQGPGGYYASRAAFVGGFDGTSNVIAALDYNIPVSGTMAHSFIESYDDELSAFIHFAEIQHNDCVLVVDTYDTLRSGLPNAITVAKKMEANGMRLTGIRLDSGDLAYLAKESRRRLDREGLNYVKIAVSNQLDEYIIKSLLEQQAPIDVFGVGTSLVTGHPDAALDGVYKLSFSNGKPRIKLSENIGKITLPHKKQVLRIIDKDGDFIGADAIIMADEADAEIMYHPLYPLKSLLLKNYVMEPVLHKVMEKGVREKDPLSLKEIKQYSRSRLEKLPEEYKRFDNPHIYKVGISKRLQSERDRLIDEFKKDL
jgi:nicotinate phosphoribosyltransferase